MPRIPYARRHIREERIPETYDKDDGFWPEKRPVTERDHYRLVRAQGTPLTIFKNIEYTRHSANPRRYWWERWEGTSQPIRGTQGTRTVHRTYDYGFYSDDFAGFIENGWWPVNYIQQIRAEKAYAIHRWLMEHYILVNQNGDWDKLAHLANDRVLIVKRGMEKRWVFADELYCGMWRGWQQVATHRAPVRTIKEQKRFWGNISPEERGIKIAWEICRKIHYTCFLPRELPDFLNHSRVCTIYYDDCEV